jgi:predicted LPLAT superfamily acyltransferase
MSDDLPARLRTSAGFAQPDDFYEILIETHRGLSAADSARLNARLILLLANHIGDVEVLREALAEARRGLRDQADARG